MRKFMLLRALATFLILVMPFSNVYSQQRSAVEGKSNPTIKDLEKELDKTLKSVKFHFEDVQGHLDQTTVGRDPDLDKAIVELDQEQQSLLETFEGLGQLLLKIHGKLKKETDVKSETTLKDVENAFLEALTDINKYIAEREEYWEGREINSDAQLKEELKLLQEDQEFIEGIVEDLASALSDAWKEVMANWGDALKSWEDMVRDMYSGEE